MPSKQRYTATQVAQALTKTHGLVYLAAKHLKCDVDTVYNYCKRYPSVQAARDAMRGQMVDLAEQKLLESIEKGEAWGISLCLKTLGKDRGYAERHEHTGEQGGALLVKVIYENAPAIEPFLPGPSMEASQNGHAS